MKKDLIIENGEIRGLTVDDFKEMKEWEALLLGRMRQAERLVAILGMMLSNSMLDAWEHDYNFLLQRLEEEGRMNDALHLVIASLYEKKRTHAKS